MSETEVPSAVPADLSLRHVMLVGGTLAQWCALTDDEWVARVDELGTYLGSIGVPWLTIRPYEMGPAEVELTQRPQIPVQVRAGCTVIVDPSADGRARFAAAMRSLPSDDEVNEATVSGILYEPADSEPDLVLVLGRSDELPPSLVWEIAYAELYFADVAWSDLTPAVVETAVDGFANRRRRFGGLPGDSDDSAGVQADHGNFDAYDDYDDSESDLDAGATG